MEAITGAHNSFIIFTDIYRSTKLWEKYPHEFKELLHQHNLISERTASLNQYEVLKNLGDGYLVAFASPKQALDFAITVQKELTKIPQLPDGSNLLLRVALHAGPVRQLPEANEYFGPTLNRASRICQVCNPGQVLISDDVAEELRELPEEVQLFNLGSHHLRDLAEPEQLFQLDHPEFALHKFPPLLTLGNRPNNLVYQPNSFVGRDKELKELTSLLLERKQRLITITAPGGYGKSRLATQLCANLLDHYENGVFEILLAPVSDYKRVVSSAADALRFQFYSKAEPKEQLLDYLREKNMLISFDNFEHITESKELLKEILKTAPKISILVTSREPLRLTGEMVYSLEPLPVEVGSEAFPYGEGVQTSTLSSHAKKQIDFISDSVQLFIDRAVLVKRDLALTLENLKLVNELCASLEGIPLAIELAAGWADSFTLAELLAAVSQQLELTARMDDVPERQRSIRASLDWSYGMLNDEQAAVLRAVAIFKGGFFFEAIESMSRRPDLRKLLTGFCDKGWLFTREVMGKTRYFIRDVATHQYAFEKLKLSEEFSERSLAHAEYFADLTNYEGERLSGRDEVEAIRALTLEIENIYVALDAALAQEDIRLIMPFVKFLKRYISAVCKWQEGVEHYRKMVKASERFTSNTLKVHSQLGLSAFLRLLGNYAEAEITANDALSYSVEAGDSTLKALSLSSLGAVASGQGRFAEAEELHKESLRILHETDDKERTAAASLYLGVSVYNQGRLKAAKGYFKESLRMSTELGDRSGIASSLHSLGRVARYRGHYSEAEKLDQESLQIQIELGNRCGIANCLYNLGRSAHGQKRYAEAEKLFNDSLQITRELGERWGIASSLLMLGDIACIQGSYAEAEKLYSESMIICREAGFRPMLATSLTSLGIVNARQGRGLNARECLLDSIRIAKEIALRVDYTGLVLAGYLLATSRSLNDAAIVLNRTADIAQAEGKNLNPIEQNMIDEGMGIILTELSKEELTALKEQGEKMTLDELANYTLKALEGTKERGKG